MTFVDIQSLFTYNPKTKEYLIRIGKHFFPFKSADEVLAYFLGKFKITKLRQSRETLTEPKTSNFSYLFLTHRYLSNYLTNYQKSLNHKTQNIPKRLSEVSLHFLKFFMLRCSF